MKFECQCTQINLLYDNANQKIDFKNARKFLVDF